MRRLNLMVSFLASFSLFVSLFPGLAHAQAIGSGLNHWTQAADLTAARAQACAVVLKDGRMLVAGGLGASGTVATVDIYGLDGAFTAAHAMTQARANAGCATMTDGRVLVAGGSDGTGSLNTAEVYDPTSDQWQLTGTLSVPREGLRVAVTPWGVWVAGGTNNGAVSGVLELYNPVARQFVPVGALNTPRSDFAMAASDRDLVIAGGTDGKNTLDSVEVYDSALGTVKVAGSLLQARKNFSAAGLVDGTVLMTGGLDINGAALATTEVFDPAKGVSAQGPALLSARANHTAYALPGNGSVLIYGGSGDSGVLGTTEIYAPWTAAITHGTPLINARRDEAKAILRSGSYIVAGGRNEAGVVGGSEVFQFSTITTGQPDYAPGTAVDISGGGWVPGEQVLVTITAFPIDQHHVEFTAAAVADGAGNIKVPGFAVDKSHQGMKFLMNAIGSQSQAETTFTDKVDPTITYAYSPALNTLTPTAPLAVTVTLTGTSGTPTGQIIPCTNGTCPTPLTIQNTGGCDNATKICTLTSGQAVVTFTSFPAGASSFSIDYSGDVNYNAQVPGGNAPVQNFTVAYTITKLAGGPPPGAAYGDQTPYVATVCLSSDNVNCNTGGHLNGQVVFNVNGTPSSPVTVGSQNDVAGTATASFIPATPLNAGGPYPVFAIYAADTNFPGSTSGTINTTISAQAAPFTISVSGGGVTNGGTASVGVSLTFTAMYGGSTSPAPIGTISFYNGAAIPANLICTATLSSGSASCSASSGPTPLAPGAVSVSIAYSPGNGNYTLGTTNAFSFTVTKAATTITLTPTPATVNVGDTVTLTATVTTTGATITPTGPVTITVPATNVRAASSTCGTPTAGATTANSATYSCTFVASGPVPAGGTSVTASGSYGGDTSTSSSSTTAPGSAITINQDPTTTTVVATSGDSPAATFIGHVVTLTATTSTTNGVQPDWTKITIAPPVGNSANAPSGTPCASPTHVVASDTASSVTVQCTFLVTGPLGSGTITANASYASPAGDTTTGTATSSGSTNISIQNAATSTALTYTSVDSPDPNTPLPTYIGHTVTLKAVVTTTTAGVQNPDGSTILPTASKVSFTLPSNSANSTCNSGAWTVTNGTNNITVTCSFLLTGPLPGGAVTASAQYTGDAAAGTAASGPVSASIGVLADVTTTSLTFSSDNSPNPAVPNSSATEIGRTVTLIATVTVTTPSVLLANGSSIAPTAANVSITPPAGNSSNSTCTPAGWSVTVSGQATTITCRFLLTGPYPGGSTVTATAAYAADSTVGTAASGPANRTINVTKAVTTTSLAVSSADGSDHIQLGQIVTLTATAKTDNTGTGVEIGPSGTFTFSLPAGTYLSPSCGSGFTVTPTAGQISVTTPYTGVANQGMTSVTCTFTLVPASAATALNPNTYSVTYNGDTLTTSSSGAAMVTPVKANTSLSATTSSPSSSGVASSGCGPTYYFGQTFTISATLTAATGLPGDGAAYAATKSLSVPLNGFTYFLPITATSTGGAFSVTAPAGLSSPPPAGCYVLTVSYPVPSADSYYAGSSTTVSFTIAKVPTQIKVLSIPATLSGQPNLEVVVAPASSLPVTIAGTPTGNVQVLSGTSLVTTSPLTANSGANCAGLPSPCGTAFFSLPSGNYGAAYVGDANFAAVTTLQSTTTTGVTTSSSVNLTATPNPAQPGQTVTFTATVNGVNGSAVPTGTVSFSDNGVIVAVIPLLAGVATYPDTSLTPGSHNILATYSGDGTYPGSSFSLGVSVSKISPNSTFSATPSAPVAGQPVTLSVRLTAPTQGGALPTGTVTFFNNGASIGTATLSNGVATLTVDSLPPGVNNISVQYSGDGTYATLTKNVGTVNVGAAVLVTTSTVLTVSVNGTQMTLTATVTPASTGSGAPTGSVQFVDTVTGTVLGTVNNISSGGVATLTIPVTNDPIVAIYSGDSSFMGSTSPASGTISVTNAASYVQSFAPNTIATLFGANLTTQILSGTLPLPMTLGGASVTVTDSAGVQRQTALFYVSPTQISFLIPAGTALGTATVAVTTASGTLAASINIVPSAAALFTANANGMGPLAAQVFDYPAKGGSPTYVTTATLSGTTFVNVPVSLSPAADSFYLAIYGTGFDNAKSVTVTINGQTFTPSYFGPQGTYVGLDQINVLLPQSLANAGQVNVSITVDGQVSNVGTMVIGSGGTN